MNFDKPTTSKSFSEFESREFSYKNEDEENSGDDETDKVKIKRENSSSSEADHFKEPFPVEPTFKVPISTVKKEPAFSSSLSSSPSINSSTVSNVFKKPSSDKQPSEKRKLSALDEIMEVRIKYMLNSTNICN
jgi:hypothetical protein